LDDGRADIIINKRFKKPESDLKTKQNKKFSMSVKEGGKAQKNSTQKIFVIYDNKHFYGGLPPIVGEVGVSVSRYSVDGDGIVGEIRLRIELDEGLERDIYGLGGGLAIIVSVVGEVAMGRLGVRSPVTGKSPRPGITSMPKSSVKGRGGGRSTIASRSF
jgi:hypothetical protein